MMFEKKLFRVFVTSTSSDVILSCIFQKIYLLVPRPPLIMLMSAFFCKKSAFVCKNSTFTQSNSMKAVLEIFSSPFRFCKIKGYCYLASGWLQIGHKSEKYNGVLTFRHDAIVKFFLTLPCLSCQVQLLIQVTCQYHNWFWSYDNFRV